jgi:tellurite methyltransferase
LSQEPLEMVKKAAKLLPPNSKILDLAVGEGRHALYFAKKGHAVVGVDVSQENFEEIEEKVKEGKIELVQKDILEYETEEKYDLVICTGLLHFFAERQVKMIIQKMKKWTKKGGYNLIAVRMDQNPRGSLSHVFAPGELKKHYNNWQIVKYEEVEKKDFPARKVEVILSRKG